MRNLFILFVLMLNACTPNNDKQVKLSETALPLKTKNSVITTDNTQQDRDLVVATFPVPTGGYGYEIFMNGSKIIYQPPIPGLPGNIGFVTAENRSPCCLQNS